MILYLDASALVKRYIAETGSDQVGRIIAGAETIGTSIISRPEVSAALAKAVRVKLLSGKEAVSALRIFRAQWGDLVRILLNETMVGTADELAWEHSLRGYDAVHLASALFWQDAIGGQVVIATYDRQLWKAANRTGLAVFPSELPAK